MTVSPKVSTKNHARGEIEIAADLWDRRELPVPGMLGPEEPSESQRRTIQLELAFIGVVQDQEDLLHEATISYVREDRTTYRRIRLTRESDCWVLSPLTHDFEWPDFAETPWINGQKLSAAVEPGFDNQEADGRVGLSYRVADLDALRQIVRELRWSNRIDTNGFSGMAARAAIAKEIEEQPSNQRLYDIDNLLFRCEELARARDYESAARRRFRDKLTEALAEVQELHRYRRAIEAIAARNRTTVEALLGE